MVYFTEKPIEMDDLGIPLWIGNLRYLWPKAKWAGNHELWMLYKQKNIVTLLVYIYLQKKNFNSAILASLYGEYYD